MPQFAVYRNENLGSCEDFPFLVDVQADLLEELGTRVVVPLARSEALIDFPTQYLTPLITFQGRPYALLTPQLARRARSAGGEPGRPGACHINSDRFPPAGLLTAGWEARA
jgi:toxin CcdB